MTLKILKGLLFILALWYFAEWAYVSKLKPYLKKEFGSGQIKTRGADSVIAANDTIAFSNDTSSQIHGVDISVYQGKEVKDLDSNDGLSFVYCRASIGMATDSLFNNNWRVLKEKTFLKRGAYHVYDFTFDPQSQAAIFIRTIGKLSNTDLPPMLDIETNPKTDFNMGSYPGYQSNILAFLKMIQDSTHLIPIIYTNKYDGNKFLTGPGISNYPLWIAHPDLLAPQRKDLPTAWAKKEWTIWQKKAKLFENNLTDFDVFKGNAAAFNDFITNSKFN